MWVVFYQFVAKLIVIAVSITLHEYTKAVASTRLGDIKPKQAGRLTINPLKHLDIFGTMCLFVWHIGWGKPVETSSVHYVDRRSGTFIVYTLPSFVNLLFGISIGFVIALLNETTVHPFIAYLVTEMAIMNISVAIFNLIPVYPLDGFKIAALFLKSHTVMKMIQYEKVFQFLLIFLMMIGAIQMMMYPIIRWLLPFVK